MEADSIWVVLVRDIFVVYMTWKVRDFGVANVVLLRLSGPDDVCGSWTGIQLPCDLVLAHEHSDHYSMSLQGTSNHEAQRAPRERCRMDFRCDVVNAWRA